MNRVKITAWWLIIVAITLCISLLIFLSGGRVAQISTRQIAGQTVDSPLPLPSVTVFEPTGTPPGPDWVATHEVLVATEAAFGPDIPDLSYPTNTPAPTTVIGPEPTAFFPVEGTPAGTGAIVLDIPPFKIVPAMVQWENTWIKNYDQNRKQIRVWAGATGGPDLKPSAQGLLAIIMFEFAPERHGMTFSTGGDLYYTPTQSGAVRIVDAVDETLILQSTGGDIYYFDLPLRRFVAAIPGGTPTPVPIINVAVTTPNQMIESPPQPPTPTVEPLPTAIPTPEVTAVPIAIPPYIEGLSSIPLQPFWTYYRKENEIRRIDSLQLDTADLLRVTADTGNISLRGVLAKQLYIVIAKDDTLIYALSLFDGAFVPVLLPQTTNYIWGNSK